MNVSALLNPLTTSTRNPRPRCVSTPLLHKDQSQVEEHSLGKSRSRFSEYEDNVIRDGVAQGLTWGQISELLPHRKRATCFNRYRTLQGIRKSRKQSAETTPQQHEMIYQTKLPFTLPVSEVNSETSSSSDDDDDESSYTPPPMTKSHRLHGSLALYRRHSAFHHL